VENDLPPNLSEEALREITSTATKDWIRITTRRSYEAWELARKLEKENLEHTTKSGEWWREAWRWKACVDEQLERLEATVADMKTVQAVSAEQMKSQVRLWSFAGSIAGGIVVGVVLLALRLLSGTP
jgi:hypothetical protein